MRDDASDATPTSPTGDAAGRNANGDDREGSDSTVEKWMVRFFLFLIFGVAFGIEGRTLIQTYLSSTEDDAAAEVTQPAETERRVGPGDALLPGLPARVRDMRFTAAARGDWTYRLTVAPDSLGADTLTVTLGPLTTNADDTVAREATRTWAPGDTTALTATWAVPEGQQPESIRITARHATPDTTVTRSETVPLTRTPVRME